MLFFVRIYTVYYSIYCIFSSYRAIDDQTSPTIHSFRFWCHLRPGYGLVPIEDQNVPRQEITYPCCLGNNVTSTSFRSIHGTLMAAWYTILHGSKPADVCRISALNSIQKLFQRMMACFFLPLIQYPFFLEGTCG